MKPSTRAFLLAGGWALFTVVAMFVQAIRSSLPLIFFMSGYAIVVSHMAEGAAQRAKETAER